MTGRREVIKAGIAGLAAGGFAAGFAARLAAAEKPAVSSALLTRAIPATGERVAAMGVGTNNYSPTTPEEREARRAVLKGLTDAGASVIDTAPGYRQSEETIGELLGSIGNRNKAFIATKVTAASGKVEEGAAMIAESQRRLKTDVLDLVQIHSLRGVDVLFPLLADLKAKKRIRYFGITTSSSEQHAPMLELMNRQPLDFIQVDYSLGNRAAAAEVLPKAIEKKIGVLINLPFGGRRDGNLFSRVAGRGLPDWAGEIDARSWGQVFLKYVISHPAVTAAIPGMTKIAHLEDNLGALRGRLPDAALRARIEKYWDENFEA